MEVNRELVYTWRDTLCCIAWALALCCFMDSVAPNTVLIWVIPVIGLHLMLIVDKFFR